MRGAYLAAKRVRDVAKDWLEDGLTEKIGDRDPSKVSGRDAEV